MSISVDSGEALAVDVSCSADCLCVTLTDGRMVSVPLAWFPRLLRASARQRGRWELIGGGIGIHWDAIDEDISVASLLQPQNFMRLPDQSLRPSKRLPATKSLPKRRAKTGAQTRRDA
jgi:hypothetical protein